jgi:hypothetical protein
MFVMFTIIATLALINAFCLVGGMKMVIMEEDVQTLLLDPFALQILLCTASDGFCERLEVCDRDGFYERRTAMEIV